MQMKELRFLIASGLTPNSTYAIYFSPNHFDDFGSPIVDGTAANKTIIRHSNTYTYYEWVPSGTSSTISIPVIQDNIADNNERITLYVHRKRGTWYESFLSGSTVINPTFTKITATLSDLEGSNSASLPDNGTVNEGQSISLAITDLVPYSSHSYTITGIDSSVLISL